MRFDFNRKPIHVQGTTSHGQRQKETSSQDRQAQTSQAIESYAAQEQIKSYAFRVESVKHSFQLCLVVFSFWILPGSVADRISIDPEVHALPPSDLLLSDEQIKKTEALGSFAWGLFLQMADQQSDPRRSTDAYFDALHQQPDSPVFLHYATSYFLQTGDFLNMAEKLLPIARKNPTIVQLQLVTSFALQRAGKVDEALQLVRTADEAVHPKNPKLFREHAALLWRSEEFRAVRKYVLHAARSKPLRDHYATAFALMSFYRSAASNFKVIEALDISERQRKRYKKKAYDYAIKAMERLPQQILPDGGSDAVQRKDIDVIQALLFEQNDFESSLELLAAAKSLFPSDTFIFELDQAAVLEQLDRWGEADETLKKLRENAGANPDELLALGQHYFDRKDLETAEKLLEKALFLDLASLHVRVNLAYVLNARNKYRQALQILDFIPDPPPGVLMIRGQAFFELGKYDEALECMENLEQKRQATGKPVDVDVLLFKATVLDQSGKTDEAIELAEQALAIMPDNPITLNFLGYVLADADRELNRAEHLIRRAVEDSPDSMAFRDSLAWVYFRQGRHLEALEEMNRTLRLMRDSQDEDAILFDHAGEIYEANGFPATAILFFSRSLLDSPDTKRKNILERIKKLQDSAGQD
jgi:tetratricopeptide (TPR) repeat protein